MPRVGQCLPVLLAFVAQLAACTPYTVASTARTLDPGERSTTQMLSVVPRGLVTQRDSASMSVPGYDREHRSGRGDRSDLGVRVNGGSGIILTHKQRLGANTADEGLATAVMLGGGFVNFAQHAHVEATILVSGAEHGTRVPWGAAGDPDCAAEQHRGARHAHGRRVRRPPLRVTRGGGVAGAGRLPRSVGAAHAQP
jgi:hypothetical protein